MIAAHMERVLSRSRKSVICCSTTLALGLLVVSQPVAAATFTPVIDTFEVQTNSFISTDDFSSGLKPPEGPSGPTHYQVIGPAGMTSETNSKLTMTPSLGVPPSISSPADTITVARTSAPVGGTGDAIEVRGLFDISLANSLPTINGQSFGIRLQDVGAGANDLAQLNVVVNSSGQLGVRFGDLDLSADTNTLVDFKPITVPIGADWIQLFLTKSATSTSATASFRFWDGAIAGALIAMNGSVSLFDGNNISVNAAFFSTDTSEVPLPAALPLFATILAGGGLIAWRRKRKAAHKVA